MLLLAHAAFFGHVCDDAYISFRYAYNLSHGDGLVFNPGERVMGYSDLLWVLLLALGEWLHVDAPTTAVALGAVFSAATLVILYAHWSVRCRSMLAPVAGLFFLAANGTFALWTTGGLEGPLFGLLLTLGVVGAIRTPASARPGQGVLLGVPFALAVLTRPEGLVFAMAVAVFVVLRDRTRAAAAMGGWMLLLPVLVWGALTLWTLSYYGDPLPNTYYAKAHPLSVALLVRGYRLMRGFVRAYSYAPLAIVALWGVTSRLRLSSDGWASLATLAAFLFVFLRAGGDALVFYRMWFWALPSFAMLLVESVDVLVTRSRWLQPVGWTVSLAAIASSVLPSFTGPEIAYLRHDDTFVSEIALINEQLIKLPRGTTLAANNIGVLAYGSKLNVIDMLGLTDRHIAHADNKSIGIPGHESHDGQYVLQRAPELMFLGLPALSERPDPGNAGYPSDLDLLQDHDFHGRYTIEGIPVRDGRVFTVYIRRDVDRRMRDLFAADPSTRQ